MSGLFHRLNMLAIWLLGGVLASVLVVRVWPAGRALARAGAPDEEDEWTWPKTLEVYPPHPGDPVKLVRITEDGNEVVPGKYRMPQIAGSVGHSLDAVKGWLSDASFTLKSQTSKNIVSVGITVVFPVRNTDRECGEPPREVWCLGNPHWCDGGCPTLFHNSLHWGLIPGTTASGLEARYARYRAEREDTDLQVLQGRGPLRLAPGEEMTLSPAGTVETVWGSVDPRKPGWNIMNIIVGSEGIDEARGERPCLERMHSKTGCAFAGASKFNIGIDIVYFEDGTIWGNYGYGYALPNPDGIFTRVDAHHFPGIAGPGSGQR
jgi:hypothetical protein